MFFVRFFWIKDNTEKFLAFPGGDPRLARNASKLYVFISEGVIDDNTNVLKKIKDLLIGIKKEFKKYKNIEILLCVDFDFALVKNKSNIKSKFHNKNKALTRVRVKKLRRFIENSIGVERIKFIWRFSRNEIRIKNILAPRNKTFKSKYIFDMGDYLRFCAKIFLGVLCGLLGNDFNSSKIGNDLIRIINSYSNENILREIDFKRVRPLFLEKFQENITDLNRLFIKNAISISIIKVDCQIIGIISIDSFKIDFYIGDASNLSTEQKKILGFGFTDNNSASGITLLLEDSAICYKEVSYAEYLSYCCKENLEKYLDILRAAGYYI